MSDNWWRVVDFYIVYDYLYFVLNKKLTNLLITVKQYKGFLTPSKESYTVNVKCNAEERAISNPLTVGF